MPLGDVVSATIGANGVVDGVAVSALNSATLEDFPLAKRGNLIAAKRDLLRGINSLCPDGEHGSCFF